MTIKFEFDVMAIRLIIFALLLTLNLGFYDAIDFKFTNLVCHHVNESWIDMHQCRLRAVSRNKTTLTVNLTLLHPVGNAEVTAQLFQKANGYKPWLYKVTVDGCRFLKRPYNPFAIIVYNLFKDFANLNHSCPYTGTVTCKDMFLRFEKLPHVIPTGDYLLALSWIFSKKLQLKTDIYFSFDESL